MNKKIVHDALVLFAFTVVLGLILGVVYGITKPSIDQVNYEKTQAAYKQVFEDAASFEEYSDFDADAAAALMTEKGFSDQIDSVNTALDASGNVIGYVLTVTAKDASQASITFSVGIKNDGTVNGYSNYKYRRNTWTWYESTGRSLSIASSKERTLILSLL